MENRLKFLTTIAFERFGYIEPKQAMKPYAIIKKGINNSQESL